MKRMQVFGSAHRRIWNSILLFMAVLLFYVFNCFIPYLHDDFYYSHYMLASGVVDYSHEIHSFREVLESQWHHYWAQNGRFQLHVLVQCFCALTGKWAYNLFAAIFWGVFIVMIGKLALWPQKESVIPAGIGGVLLLLLLSSEPSAYYGGISFSMNYLYPSVLSLLFIYLICCCVETRWWRKVLLVVIAVLAGCSHEAFVSGLGGGVCVYVWQNRKNMPVYKWVAISVFILCAFFLVFSPANFSRVYEVENSDGLRQKYFRMLSWLNVLGAMAVLSSLIHRKKDKLTFIRDNVFVVTAWLVANLFVVCIGWCNFRALLGAELFAFILIYRRFAEIAGGIKTGWRIMGNLAYCSFFIVMINYQIPIYNNVLLAYEVLASTQDTSCSVYLKFPELPCYLKRYCAMEEQSDWVYSCWLKKYPMAQIYKGSETPTECVFPLKDKVPGDNPFYRWDCDECTLFLSEEPLPSKIKLRLYFGDYYWWTLEGLARQCFSYVKSSTDVVDAEVQTERFSFQGRDCYRFVLWKNDFREIVSYDYIAE